MTTIGTSYHLTPRDGKLVVVSTFHHSTLHGIQQWWASNWEAVTSKGQRRLTWNGKLYQRFGDRVCIRIVSDVDQESAARVWDDYTLHHSQTAIKSLLH